MHAQHGTYSHLAKQGQLSHNYLVSSFKLQYAKMVKLPLPRVNVARVPDPSFFAVTTITTEHVIFIQ